MDLICTCVGTVLGRLGHGVRTNTTMYIKSEMSTGPHGPIMRVGMVSGCVSRKNFGGGLSAENYQKIPSVSVHTRPITDQYLINLVSTCSFSRRDCPTTAS